MWRPAEFEDLHRIRISGDPANDLRSVFSDSDESRNALREDARTWDRDGTVLAVIGVNEMWKGVGVVWTLISNEAKQSGFCLTRSAVREMNRLHAEGYWRLQATVERGDEVARLWIVRLGFSYEGTMVAYGPSMETHDMYARVRV